MFDMRVQVGKMRSTQHSGMLAQLVERRPYKANVGGSNPSHPTSQNVTLTGSTLNRVACVSTADR